MCVAGCVAGGMGGKRGVGGGVAGGGAEWSSGADGTAGQLVRVAYAPAVVFAVAGTALPVRAPVQRYDLQMVTGDVE